MRPAGRTLGCWLLAAFLERGCDPFAARVPMPQRRERPLSAAELAELRRRRSRVVFLPRPAPRAAAPPAPSRAVVLPFRRAV